jgi:hypothetical protein
MPRDDHLRERAAGVVAHEHDVLQVERLEELGDERGERPGVERRVGPQRDRVRPERPVGRDAAMTDGGERRQDVAPQQRVRQEPVEEDDRPPAGRAALGVAHRAGGERDRRHANSFRSASPKRSSGTASGSTSRWKATP